MSTLKRVRYVKKFTPTRLQVRAKGGLIKSHLLRPPLAIIFAPQAINFAPQATIPHVGISKGAVGENGLLNTTRIPQTQQKTTMARRGTKRNSSPSAANEGIFSLKRRCPSPEVGVSSSGSGPRSWSSRPNRIFPCKTLAFTPGSQFEGTMGVFKIPTPGWEGWHRLQNRPGCSRFSHQWSKDKRVVPCPLRL